MVGARECGRPPPPAGGRGRRGRQGEQEGTGGVCVCARAHGCVQASWGGAVDVFTWNHSPSDNRGSSEPGGKALPGLAEVQPVRCLCLVGWAASQDRVDLG